MTRAFRSDPGDIDVHSATGWHELSSGARITKLPVYDETAGLFARLGHGPASAWLASRGLRLPTIAEMDELNNLAHHIDPHPLPTLSMCRADRIPLTNKAIDAFRNRHIMTQQWCGIHDVWVFTELARTGWDGDQPVTNCGKHWVSPVGTIYGWWYRNGTRIQNPSKFHASEPTYVDYATTFHAVCDDALELDDDGERVDDADDALQDLSVAAHPWQDPRRTHGQRVAAWTLHHEGHTETPAGSNTSPLIDAWAEYCMRDGRTMGSLWNDKRGADWCAVTWSAAVIESALEGRAPAITGRVSVAELMADAKADGTFVPLADVLSGKVEPQPGWAVLWPRYDPGTTTVSWRGHVDTWLGWTDSGMADVIGGNVNNRVTRRRVSLTNGALSAHGFIRIDEREGSALLSDREPPTSDASQDDEPPLDKFGLIEGVDVAHYQRPELCDYPTLAKRFAFLIAKASEGTRADSTFVDHITGAREAGMTVGAYHLFVQDVPWSTQVDVMTRAAADAGYGRAGDIVPALDLEYIKGRAFTASIFSDAARKMARELTNRFGGCMVYSNLHTIALMGYPPWLDEYSLWLASQTTKPHPTGPSRWSIWQYDVKRVDGCAVAIDVNRARELPRVAA